MEKNFIEVGETLAVPHHCGICDNDFLNYVDDENFEKIENDWYSVKNSQGKVILEICPHCDKGNWENEY